jgi:hypothetical protein
MSPDDGRLIAKKIVCIGYDLSCFSTNLLNKRINSFDALANVLKQSFREVN